MKRANIILSIGVFIIGILVGKYINWPYFHISSEINSAEVLSTGASFILAFMVVRYLEKGKEERRIEKDYVISKIDDFNKEGSLFISAIRAGSIDYTLALSSFKLFNIRVKKIIKISKKIGIVLKEKEKQKIFNSLKRFKDLTTFTPRVSPVNPPISVLNNKISLTDLRISEIELEWDRLEEYLFDFLITINKAD